MIESALEKARREAQRLVCSRLYPNAPCNDKSAPCAKHHAAIDRLVAAATAEGYKRGCNDVEVMDRQTIEEAARLAGRLEQAERTIQIDRDDTLYPGKELFEALVEERDRLRELAAAGKGEK